MKYPMFHLVGGISLLIGIGAGLVTLLVWTLALLGGGFSQDEIAMIKSMSIWGPVITFSALFVRCLMGWMIDIAQKD